MNSFYENIDVTSYLQEVQREEERNHFDQNENSRASDYLSDQRSDSRSSANSNSSSFETLLPKNGFYNLDAFFDIEIISLDGSISVDEEVPLSAGNGSSAKPCCSSVQYDEIYEEHSSSFSSRGKVLDTFAFQSLKRKVDTIAEKNVVDNSKKAKPSEQHEDEYDEEYASFSNEGKVHDTFAFQSLKTKEAYVTNAKNVVTTTIEESCKISPIQASKRPYDKTFQGEKRRNQIKYAYSDDENKVQISNATKLHGTSLSKDIFGKHYNVAKFTEGDRGCKRDQLEIGYTGLACAYCDGCLGRAKGGRYFPSSFKNFADPNKVLLRMYNHLQKCLECPSSTKKHLTALREVYDQERSNQERRSQRKFHRAIWDFLRKKDVC